MMGDMTIHGSHPFETAREDRDPLRRFHVSLRGVTGDNPSMVERFPDDGMFDRHGVLVAPRWSQA